MGKRKPGPTRWRVLACPPTCVPHKHLQPELVRQSNSCVGWCVHSKKKYHNVARQSPLIFFDLSASNLVQESSVDLWDNLNKVRGLPHNALHFPSYFEHATASVNPERKFRLRFNFGKGWSTITELFWKSEQRSEVGRWAKCLFGLKMSDTG